MSIWCPRWQKREKKINNFRARFFALSSSLYIRRRFTIPTCGSIRYYILTFKKKQKQQKKGRMFFNLLRSIYQKSCLEEAVLVREFAN